MRIFIKKLVKYEKIKNSKFRIFLKNFAGTPFLYVVNSVLLKLRSELY